VIIPAERKGKKKEKVFERCGRQDSLLVFDKPKQEKINRNKKKNNSPE